MTDDFGDVQVYTGQPAAIQDFSSAPPPVPVQMGMNTLATPDQARAVAEAQAMLVLAKSAPRNENAAVLSIQKACKRRSLAERATYAYRRGGTMVTGPSVRLAEVLAAHWGNITYGFREVSRKRDSVEVEAFAWDLQTNTRVTRSFTVKLVRDTKQGAQELTAERDKYELVASMAQRRVRAVLLELIPGDIVEDALDMCQQTLQAEFNNNPEEAKRKLILAFDELGVTLEMLEEYLSHSIKALQPAELVRLREVYRAIKDGVAPISEFFTPAAAKKEQAQAQPAKDDVQPQNDEAGSEDGQETGEQEQPKRTRMSPEEMEAMRQETYAYIESLGLTVDDVAQHRSRDPEKWAKADCEWARKKAEDLAKVQEPDEPAVQSEEQQGAEPPAATETKSGPGETIWCPEAETHVTEAECAECPKAGDCPEYNA
ncbi:hypothetical protein [Oceanidesulfovibrio marinus]|uniref:Uncharacterized protein n=1 Tax=Oceanidesulfovibrio marinus TaxID=370038 RepID=A0A6P1ZBB6_9BACT|nr:hypothetical protein [Oceanidesulfovibrio marinus]TVM31205.1 hypothetical protein DQK91_19030 [Oceanidesulfovibrio marinus]